jgi:hypothetical protein
MRDFAAFVSLSSKDRPRALLLATGFVVQSTGAPRQPAAGFGQVRACSSVG